MVPTMSQMVNIRNVNPTQGTERSTRNNWCHGAGGILASHGTHRVPRGAKEVLGTKPVGSNAAASTTMAGEIRL